MATDARLTRVNPDLAGQISAAAPHTQRQIALATVQYAFSQSPEKAGADDALAALRDARYGDPGLRARLRSAAGHANIASDNAAENGDHESGTAQVMYAGALMAAYYALHEDAEKAALEAVYETASVVKPRAEFEGQIRGFLA